jgi:hypothetical protein
MQFGGTQVTHAQLDHLIKVSEQPHVTLRVIPFDGTSFPTAGHGLDYAHGPVLPQPRQPALTHPLRDHPSSPWTPGCPLISLSPHPAIVLASGTELSLPQVSAWL